MSTAPGKVSATVRKHEAHLRRVALGYPETREDRPWDHAAFKVREKTFCFMVADAEGFSVTVKLPESNALALMLDCASPTGYGLGKSGWVSARWGPKDAVPMDMILEWVEESFRAVAPKKLWAQRQSVAAAPKKAAPKHKAAPKKAAPKKTASKKSASKKAAPKKAASKKSASKKAASKTR